MSPTDAIAVASEALAWLTLPFGVVLLIAALARRSWAHRYVAVKGVVTNVQRGDVTVRWFSDGGAVHEATAEFDEPAPLVGDARTIWVHPARPDSLRVDDPSHDGRVLLTVGAILGVVGMVSVVLSFVLPLL